MTQTVNGAHLTDEDQAQKPPIQDLGAERAVIGSIVWPDVDVMGQICDVLQPDDFFEPVHQAAYEAALAMHGRGENIDAVTLSAEMDRRGDLALMRRSKGQTYLLDLWHNTPTPTSVRTYAETVAAKGSARRLVEAGWRLAARAGLPDVDLDALLTEHQAAIGDARPLTGRGLPDAVLLDDLLSEPDAPVHYRVDRLWPTGGRVLFAAQFKAGKTTADHNLVRSLVDGEPFLGEFEVTVPVGRVAVLDTELDREMLKRWLRAQDIRNAGQVALYSLRGQLGAFNILDAPVRRQWAERLRALDISVLVLDCLRPALDALGLSEDKEAGRFFVAFDALLAEASIGEAVIVHHMGHSGERSRGDSRLRDWPDAEWKLVREQSEEDQPAAPRYFSAYGRDVDVPEAALHYNPDTRHLTLAGTGNRREAAARTVIPALLALLEDNPDGLSGRRIEAALVEAGEKRGDVRQALKLARADGRVSTEKGPNRADIHRVSVRRRTHLQTFLVDDGRADPDWRTEPSRSPAEMISDTASAPGAPPVRQRTAGGCASALIESARTHTDAAGAEATETEPEDQ